MTSTDYPEGSGAPAPAPRVPAPAPQPDALATELGLTGEEYERIVATCGRTPSTAELGTYSVMWSEHCSYKTSKIHLRRLPTQGPQVLVGPGENAGVVDVGDGLAVAFKIESHNHPSFVEPVQGAATGVGGIIRDILTMGARPIALLDPLRFGEADDPVSRRVADGVVRGIGRYGNAIGVPTVGGEVDADPCYAGNPLVNVLCVGVVDREGIQYAKAERVGDVAVLIGQRTGRDGIGGASVLSSATFEDADDEAGQAKRPNVQVGDPFAGKLLIEACLELYQRRLVSGIQDMGAAGIACSTAEMASAAGLGMRVDLDRVPLREPSMESWEILCSESQERMLALVHPDRLEEVLATCRRWGVDATPIGEVTDGDRLVFTRGGEVVHDAPAASIAHEGPTYDRPREPWAHPHAHESPDADEPAPADPIADWLALLDHPRASDPTPIAEQYDSAVGSSTVAGPGGDAAVLRLPAADGTPGVTLRGVAVATDGNGRRCALDPAEGARQVVAEAARNVACTGARPLASTNNLNFGDPTRPPVMEAFARTIDGLGEACRALDTPITGGNVSFYNATGGTDIHPTPVVGVLGAIDDVTAAVPAAFQRADDAIVLLGAPTLPGLAGSLWLWHVRGRLAGALPAIDLAVEAALQRLLVDLAGDGLLASAHDVTDGGLAVTLVESAVHGGLGADLTPEPGLAPHQWLFSESPSRAVASVAPGDLEAVREAAAAAGVACTDLGAVATAPRLRVTGLGDLDLGEAQRRRQRGVARLLGEPAPADAPTETAAPTEAPAPAQPDAPA